jgi:hypothetical protein
MMGENVTRPEPIAEWISDLKKRLTLGVDLLRYTALSPDLAFQPSLDAQRPPPLQSTALLCWMDSTLISCDDGYWTCPVDCDAGVFEQHLGGLMPSGGAVKATNAGQPQEPSGQLIVSSLELCAKSLCRHAHEVTVADKSDMIMWQYLQGRKPIVKGRYWATDDIWLYHRNSKDPYSVWKKSAAGQVSVIWRQHSGAVWVSVTLESAPGLTLWGHVLTPGSFCSIRPDQEDMPPAGDAMHEESEEADVLREKRFHAMMKDAWRDESGLVKKQGDKAPTGQHRVTLLTWKDCRVAGSTLTQALRDLLTSILRIIASSQVKK